MVVVVYIEQFNSHPFPNSMGKLCLSTKSIGILPKGPFAY